MSAQCKMKHNCHRVIALSQLVHGEQCMVIVVQCVVCGVCCTVLSILFIRITSFGDITFRQKAIMFWKTQKKWNGIC